MGKTIDATCCCGKCGGPTGIEEPWMTLSIEVIESSSSSGGDSDDDCPLPDDYPLRSTDTATAPGLWQNRCGDHEFGSVCCEFEDPPLLCCGCLADPACGANSSDHTFLDLEVQCFSGSGEVTNTGWALLMQDPTANHFWTPDDNFPLANRTKAVSVSLDPFEIVWEFQVIPPAPLCCFGTVIRATMTPGLPPPWTSSSV